jgi:predicted Zn-ribbon and HTH transcriptional regulator
VDPACRKFALQDLQRTIDEMELSLDVVPALCSSCGFVNLFPGFTKIDAFICRKSGASKG